LLDAARIVANAQTSEVFPLRGRCKTSEVSGFRFANLPMPNQVRA
jgi:hypothetical protein